MAAIKAAQIALNDGDYDEVISLIGGEYDPSAPDSQVARLLASAYREVFPQDIDWSSELDDLAAYIDSHGDILSSGR